MTLVFCPNDCGFFRDFCPKVPGYSQLLQHFEIEAVEAIDQLLTQRIEDNQLDDDTFNPVYTAMATRSRNGLPSVASQVFSRLRSGETFSGDQIAHLVKTLRVSNLADLIDQDDYNSFANGGSYLHHLYNAVSESHAEAVAECMFGFLEAVPDRREPNHFGNSSPGYQSLNQLLENPDNVPGSVEHFVSLVKEAEQLPVVFKIRYEDGSISPFVAEVLHSLLTSKDVSKTSALVSENWALIREVLREGEESSESFEAFLKDLPGIDNLVDDILSEDFDVHDCALYFALLRSSTSSDFATWCVEGLSSVTQDVWSEAIASQGDLLDLLRELKTCGVNVALGAAYYDALVDYAEQVSDDFGECAHEGYLGLTFSHHLTLTAESFFTDEHTKY